MLSAPDAFIPGAQLEGGAGVGETLRRHHLALHSRLGGDVSKGTGRMRSDQGPSVVSVAFCFHA